MASIVLENDEKSKNSGVDFKAKFKGIAVLLLVLLLVGTGFVAALIVMVGQVQSLKVENQNLKQDQEHISMDFEARIRKISQDWKNDEQISQAKIKNISMNFEARIKNISKERANDDQINQAKIKNLTQTIEGLLNYIKPFEEFIYATNLTQAAELGNLNIVRLLLETGADINSRGHDKMTALHMAASKGHLEVVKLLLEHGAKKGLKDVYDYTPLDWAYYKRWAESWSFSDIIEVLEKN